MLRKKDKQQQEFEKAYDENIERIFRFVYLKVGNKDDAEDVTSQVFVRFWKLWGEKIKKKEKLDNPRALLYTIARNLIIDYYRKNRPERDEKKDSKKKKSVSVEDVIVVDKQMRADEKAVLDSQIEEVMQALGNINEDYQSIIIWYYLDELTSAEIAKILDKPESSVRVLIHRAVGALKKEMEKKEK